MTRKDIASLGTVACLALLVAGCVQVPGTGRSQLMLIGEQEETRLGEEAWQQILAKENVSTHPRANEILQRVGGRIAQASSLTHLDWEFKLFVADQVNAFALPGGKVGVYSGILPVCRNEAGLAAVIGHEVGHVLARHGGERISHSLLVQIGAKALEAAMRNGDPGTTRGVMAAFGLGADLGFVKPYSRTHESEADRFGIELMAKTGYDPAEAPRLWQRMEEQYGGSGIELLSTHPAHETRIRDLRAMLPHAKMLYEQAPQKHGLGAQWVESPHE